MKIKYYKMSLTSPSINKAIGPSKYNVYRISEFTPCCERMKYLPSFETGFLNDKVSDEQNFSAFLRDPVFDKEGKYIYDDYYRIAYCPFCGEKIEMEFLGEKNPDNGYNALIAKKMSLINRANNSDSQERYQGNVDELRDVILKISKDYGNNSHKDFVPEKPDKNTVKKMKREAEKDYTD